MKFPSLTRMFRMQIPRRMSFVIFASPKSGTTWLQRLISHHPDALCAESRPFGDYFSINPPAAPHITLEKFCGLLGDYFAPGIPGLEPDNSHFRRELTQNFLDTLAETALTITKKSVYGEKFTPYRGTSMAAVESLRAYNANMRFVNLTRDGRDVIASGAAQWLNLRLRRAAMSERAHWQQCLEARTIVPEDFDMFLDFWTDAARAGLDAEQRFPNHLHLRYEDFVEQPCAMAARLFDFLALKSSDALVRACVESASFDRLSGGRKCGQEDINSFFRKGVVGDWKSWFTFEQQQTFDKAAGTLLTRLGYQRGVMEPRRLAVV